MSTMTDTKADAKTPAWMGFIYGVLTAYALEIIAYVVAG